MSGKSPLRTLFNSQHAKGVQTSEISRTALLSCFSITLAKQSLKLSLLVISEILGLFLTTFTVDDKFFLQNSKDLRQPIHMQLSRKEKKHF